MSGGRISPWMPEQDRIRLALLGKLVEELGEATQRAARCITHGIDEVDPDTGRSNREELARELADVDAAAADACRMLLIPRLDERVSEKKAGFFRWRQLIREAEDRGKSD